MTSRDDIKAELVKIGQQAGYVGEMVEISADLLSYVLYTNQVEIANSTQESSLTTAKLLNSKIKLCMESMYSVYRGKNARVKLMAVPVLTVSKSRFDLLYESNTFKVYADNNFTISSNAEVDDVDDTTKEPVEVTGILVAGTKYEYDVVPDANTKYYIDILDANGHPLSNLSEEIKVTIDGQEYPTTRDFYDHINTPISNDPADLDKIFVLTTTDYGIRLYKRGYIDDGGNIRGFFEPGKKVHIETMVYTTIDDINPDEFNKILVPGAELRPTVGTEFIYRGIPCEYLGSASSVDELPSHDAPSPSMIGDTYDVESELYTVIDTETKNPNYDPTIPPTITIQQVVNMTGEVRQLSYSDLVNLDEGTAWNIKGKLAAFEMLPVSNNVIGDTYIINNTAYVFKANGENGAFTTESVGINSFILYVYAKDVNTITYKGIIENTSQLNPQADNKNGDTYVRKRTAGSGFAYVIYTYLPAEVPNPKYEENGQEYITGPQYVNIGNLSDFNNVEGLSGRSEIPEVARETAESILYDANVASRTQSTILSSADICNVFTENFIEDVYDSRIRYFKITNGDDQQGSVDTWIPDSDALFIFYAPKVLNYQIPSDDILKFVTRYNSYFITNNILAFYCKMAVVDIYIDLTLSSNVAIRDQIEAVLNQYSYKLPSLSGYTESDIRDMASVTDKELTWDYDYYSQLVNLDQIYSAIAKIPSVAVINEIRFDDVRVDGSSRPDIAGYQLDLVTRPKELPTSGEYVYDADAEGNGKKVRSPLYYTFNPSISLRNIYEALS